MRITEQPKIVIKRDKIQSDDKAEFYNYWKYVITEINSILDNIRQAVNYVQAAGEFITTSNIIPSAASTWETVTFDDPTTLNQRIKLLSGNQTIEVTIAGWYIISYNVIWENTQGTSLKATSAHRLLKNDVEIVGSEAIAYTERTQNDFFNLSQAPVMVKLSKGDTIKLQYYAGDVDLIISANPSIFDSATAAHLVIRQMEST